MNRLRLIIALVHVLVLALVVVPTATSLGQGQASPRLFRGKVSALAIPPAELGAGWDGPTGLVIDDFSDLSKYPADVQDLAESLKSQVSAIGVVATADFTYRRKLNALQQITVRIFVFDSEKSCRDWWEKKYRYAGWEKHYSVVAGDDDSAVDSKETPKRAVAFGNVWLTSAALGESKEHVKALDLFVTKIKSQTTK